MRKNPPLFFHPDFYWPQKLTEEILIQALQIGSSRTHVPQGRKSRLQHLSLRPFNRPSFDPPLPLPPRQHRARSVVIHPPPPPVVLPGVVGFSPSYIAPPTTLVYFYVFVHGLARIKCLRG